jgi:hypothetical protein
MICGVRQEPEAAALRRFRSVPGPDGMWHAGDEPGSAGNFCLPDLATWQKLPGHYDE